MKYVQHVEQTVFIQRINTEFWVASCLFTNVIEAYNTPYRIYFLLCRSLNLEPEQNISIILKSSDSTGIQDTICVKELTCFICWLP